MEQGGFSLAAGADDGRPGPRKRARGAWDAKPPSDEEAEPSQSSTSKAAKGKGSIIGKEHLIGKVNRVRHPEIRRLCAHFLKDDCMWGDQCRFSHSAEELRAGAPVTEGMTFNNLEASVASRSVPVPRKQLKFLMTEETRQALTDCSGISSVSWDAEDAKVTISGTYQQVDAAEQLLKRVISHCNWGANLAKVSGLLRLQPCKAAKVRLSPMHPALKEQTLNLHAGSSRFTVGSGSSTDIVLKGPLISRAHATLEFIPGKGALYVVDTSTNGTFLNGIRLPGKSSGKVVVWHSDELLFPEPNMNSVMEFGYLVNVELIS